MNAGLPLVDPTGGYFYVFITGRPMFRKYNAAGALVYERHIEGHELDALLDTQPTRWPKRRVEDREVPFVPPVIRAADVDPRGNLWVSLAVRSRTSTTSPATRPARCSSWPRPDQSDQLVVWPRRPVTGDAGMLRLRSGKCTIHTVSAALRSLLTRS